MVAGASAASFSVKALFFAHFSLVGVMSPYLGLYFVDRGLGIAQVSVLLAVPQWMRVLAPPFWGALADRHHPPSRLLLGSALVCTGLIAAMALANGRFGWLLVLLAAFYFFSAAQGPISEALALAVSQGDPGRYGRLRLWGSIGFILAVGLAGPLLDGVGVGWLPLGMGGLALILALVIARWRTTIDAAMPARPIARAHGDAVWRRLREPHLAAFFVSAALMMAAHAALYSFFSLYLDQRGYSKGQIGLTWTLGVLVEIALFQWQRPLFDRFGAMSLLTASLMVAAVRFALIAASDGFWLLIVVSQLAHAITFGVHHSAAMSLLHQWFPPAQQGRAQALFVTLGYGLGGSIGGLSGGWLWEHVSPQATFVGAAAMALAGWGAARVCAGHARRAQSRQETDDA